jgi:hypothetical protein
MSRRGFSYTIPSRRRQAGQTHQFLVVTGKNQINKKKGWTSAYFYDINVLHNM